MTRKANVKHFEDKLSELDSLVKQLESNQLSLEDALKAFEKGIKLSNDCQTVLTQAEQKVQVLLEDQNGERLKTFNPETNQ